MLNRRWLTGQACLRRVAVLLSMTAVLVFAAFLAPSTGRGQSRGVALSVEVTGAIGSASERQFARDLEGAQEKGAPLVIVRLDTPGGSVDSMREMVKSLIRAPLPVVVYVAPDGARAASAGVFLTVAADVAAMAPQTNIGSATPIMDGPGGPTDIPRDLKLKAQNDLAAYARALAEGRGRNAKLASRMVSESVNVTARTAQREGLIDFVAGSERALLRSLDGFRIKGRKAQVLQTDGLRLARSGRFEQVDEGIDESDDGGLLFGLSPGLVALVMLVVAVALWVGKFGPRLKPFR